MAKEIRSAAEIKKQNVASIKRLILESESVTKPEVAEKTGLSVVTSGSILNELTTSGFLVEESLRLSSGGRPAMGYRLSEGAGNNLCLYTYTESDGTFIRYQVKDIAGKVKEEGFSQEEFVNINVLAQNIQKICRPELDVKVVVIGIQGRINHNIVESSDLIELVGHNIANEIESITGIATLVENDMNTIALGYTQIHNDKLDSNELKNVAILFFPQGQTPAGGYIVDGHILRGATNLAGDLAFVPFNATKEERQLAYSQIETARPLIDMFLISTTACLDPAVIVITGGLSNFLNESNLQGTIQQHLKRSYLPKVEVRPIMEDEYYAGLHSIAVDYLIDG